MYKILKFRTPYSLYELLDLPSDRTGRNLSLRTRTIGHRHQEKSFFSQGTRFWNKYHKKLIEQSQVQLHPQHSKKLNLVETEFSFYDFSTKVSTFKAKLKKLLLNIQSSGNTTDWTVMNYINNWLNATLTDILAPNLLNISALHPLVPPTLISHHLI